MSYSRGPIGKDLLEELDLNDAERAFVKEATVAGQSGELNRSSIIAGIYTVKNQRRMVDDFMEAAQKLAAANGRYAFALNILTGALVLVGVAQIIVQVMGRK